MLNDPAAIKNFLMFLDHQYAIICLACGKKVLDPDKKKNQIYLDGKCPSCGQLSKEIPKKSKKQIKREEKKRLREERKEAKRQARSRKHRENVVTL